MNHHALSPSAAERWMTCTAAPAFEAARPGESSAFADEGTAAHALAADILNIYSGRAPLNSPHSAVEWCRDDPQWFDPVLEYVDFVRALPGELHIEVRCSLDPWIPGGFGTADAVNWDPGTGVLYVTDLKFGRGIEVSAVGNPQLRLYALGAIGTLGLNPEAIVCTVHQPRLDNVSQERITYAALVAWAQAEVLPAVAEVASGGTYRPSGKACRFCRGRAVCAARAARQLELARLSFSENLIP